MTVSKALKDGWPDDDAQTTVGAELERQFRRLETKSSRRDAILSLTSTP